MKPRDRAWCALAASALVYDLSAGEDQTLSEGVHSYIHARPYVSRTVITVLTVHLLKVVPPRYDPLTRLYLLMKRRKVQW